jgi:purine-binding chemotaxis protein CheW
MTMCTDFVTFSLDDALYGIPVDRVQEILDLRPVAPIPGAPRHLLGVIDLRGDTVPVIDMRLLLGLKPAEDTPQTRILVVLLRAEGRQSVIGLRSDRVIDVTGLDSDELRPLDEGQLLAWDARSILGVGRRNGAIISIIDMDGLFSDALRTGLTGLSAPSGVAA